MANFGTTEILIVLLVVLLLFGSAKLPQLARSLGRSARILKTESQALHDDETGEHDAPPNERARRPPALPAGHPPHDVLSSNPPHNRQGPKP